MSLFDGELNPVAAKAQRKVPVPEGLDLEEWINTPPASDDEAEPEFDLGGTIDFGLGGPSERASPLTYVDTALDEAPILLPRASKHSWRSLIFSFSYFSPFFHSVESDDEDTKRKKKQERLAAQSSNPFHLGAYETLSPRSGSGAASAAAGGDLDDIPITKLDVDVPIKLGAYCLRLPERGCSFSSVLLVFFHPYFLRSSPDYIAVYTSRYWP
jgi:AP-3 complex subunit delta-1